MQISTSIVGTNNYVVLIDSAMQATLEAFAPKVNATVQHQKLAGGLAWFRQPVGNISITLALKWNQVYGSYAAALASVRTIAALYNVKFHLQVAQDSEVQYYPNAALLVPGESVVQGLGANHSILLTTDNVQVNAP